MSVSIGPPTTADDHDILALMRARYAEFAIGPEVLAGSLDFYRSLPEVDPSVHQRVARIGGSIVGAAIAWPEVGLGRLTGFGYVHPDARARGIGTAFLEWYLDLAAAERVTLASLDVPSADRTWRDMIARAGFVEARTMTSMRHDRPDTVTAAPFPDGVTTSTDLRGEELLETLIAAHDAAFAEHWDYQPGRYRTLIGPWVAREDFDPSLVRVARGPAGELLGYTIGLIADGVGDVDEIGVVPGARRRGLGAALLRACLADLAARGARAVTLGVDSENGTGAVRLYERVGFTAVSTAIIAHRSFTA